METVEEPRDKSKYYRKYYHPGKWSSIPISAELKKQLVELKPKTSSGNWDDFIKKLLEKAEKPF